MAIKSIKINNLPARAALAAGMLLCIVGVVFFVRWCAGNAISQNTVYLEVADLAVSLAPNDPQTHYTRAVLRERAFKPEDLTASLAEYEQAAALAPDDYRTWLALGRARERDGDAAGAERALRKSVELAPNYSEVRWILGNILLRQGKREEAFAELRRAAETDSRYTNPAAATVWQLSGGDLPQINRYFGDSIPVKSALVVFLIREKRFDEATAIWKSLPENDRKTTFRENGNLLYAQLRDAGRYLDALQILTETSGEEFVAGKIFNGGFESDVKALDASFFDWRIEDGAQPQISIDNSQKHGGARSLVMVFNSATGREFRAISQAVAVEPEKKYAFEMFYKSELKTTATLYWRIAAPDGKILASTPAISAAGGWTNLKAEFTVPEKTEAVVITPVRELCRNTLCPISGRVWFDDFSLTQRP